MSIKRLFRRKADDAHRAGDREQAPVRSVMTKAAIILRKALLKSQQPPATEDII